MVAGFENFGKNRNVTGGRCSGCGKPIVGGHNVRTCRKQWKFLVAPADKKPSVSARKNRAEVRKAKNPEQLRRVAAHAEHPAAVKTQVLKKTDVIPEPVLVGLAENPNIEESTSLEVYFAATRVGDAQTLARVEKMLAWNYSTSSQVLRSIRRSGVTREAREAAEAQLETRSNRKYPVRVLPAHAVHNG